MKAKRKRTGKPAQDMVKVKGFFRVHIKQDGELVGDSGWLQNQVTDLGFSHYLVDLIGAGASSKQISRMMLGTGTAPAAAATTLPGELSGPYTRQTATFANVASKTARWTATWGSAQSHIASPVTVQNLGLINNTTSGGTLMAGQTFATSQWNTNQDLQATYELRFS